MRIVQKTGDVMMAIPGVLILIAQNVLIQVKNVLMILIAVRA